MEGKGVLFKRFADIDVFDIEIDTADPKEVISAASCSRHFRRDQPRRHQAPECFEIEETPQKPVDIPVFHDDQHGTAIISGAAGQRRRGRR